MTVYHVGECGRSLGYRQPLGEDVWVARLGLGKNLTGLSPTVDESLVVKLGVQGTKLLALV